MSKDFKTKIFGLNYIILHFSEFRMKFGTSHKQSPITKLLTLLNFTQGIFFKWRVLKANKQTFF